jgi:hypothetical protein
MASVRPSNYDSVKITDKIKAFVQDELDATYVDVRRVFNPQYAAGYFGRKDTLEFLLAEENKPLKSAVKCQ